MRYNDGRGREEVIEPLMPSYGHITVTSNETGSVDNRVLLTWGEVGNELVVIVLERKE